MEDGINPYSYVSNSPILKIDPNGTDGVSFQENSILEEEYDSQGNLVRRYELHRRLTFDANGNLIDVQELEDETRVFALEPLETGETPVTVAHPEFAAEPRPRDREPPPPATPESSGATVSDVLDGVQIGLDVVGLIPVFGEIADGINALISLGRGDYAGAALSAAAMIPFAGWGATAARFGRRILDLGGSWVSTAAS